MREVDFRTVGDTVVLHFGVPESRVNTYTFANALLAFTDTVKSINSVVYPGGDVEVVIEATGPGSFRAYIRTLSKSAGNLFSVQDAKTILLALVAAAIWDAVRQSDPSVTIQIHAETVVIERENERVILPREAYEHLEVIRHSDAVQDNLATTFSILERDPTVESFGIGDKTENADRIAEIPRSKFAFVASLGREAPDTKIRFERTTVQITRAILERTDRKWQFIWQGNRISAPVKDQRFYDRFFAHEITIAPGDSLEVNLKIVQRKIPDLGLYENSSYEVTEVLEHIPRAKQERLDRNSPDTDGSERP